MAKLQFSDYHFFSKFYFFVNVLFALVLLMQKFSGTIGTHLSTDAHPSSYLALPSFQRLED